MTLKEHIAHCNEILRRYPQAAEFKVVYSVDDEGNDFKEVFYEPDVGSFDGEFNADGDETTFNAVCIN